MADDISGLPDVDLGAVVADLKNQDNDQEPTETKEKPRNELGQFKSQEDLLKGYKEVQGFSTKVSQENKLLKEQLAALKEQQEAAIYQAPQPQPQQSKSFDEEWMEDPQKAIATQVARGVTEARIKDVFDDEMSKNMAEYQERYAYANMVSQNPQYQHLSTTPQGIRQLFKMGDKLRKENLTKNISVGLESLFGEPLDEEQITNLRELVKGKKTKQKQTNNNAYMPDIDTSTITGSEQNQKPGYDVKMTEAVKKGDVDGTIDALFKGILAE